MTPSFFQGLAAHLWQSTWFAACAGLLALALRKNPAKARYWLWLAASAKFLVPFSLLIMIGAQFAARTPVSGAPLRLLSPIERVNQSFSATPLPMVVPVQPQNTAVSLAVILIALALVWATGWLSLIVSWWRRSRKIRAVLKTALPVDLPTGTKVILSTAFHQPGVFGIRKPVIILPEGIASQLTAAELAAVIAHETCHIKRRDNLGQMIHMAVEAIFWFYPLVWWVGARLLAERERACDEEVLAMGNQPEVYAEGILKICEHYMEARLPFVAAATGSNLRTRIEQIMTYRVARLDTPRKVLLGSAAVLMIAFPLTIGVMMPRSIHAQSSPADAPRFEVASIRLCKDAGPARSDRKTGPPGGSPIVSPGRLNTGCAALAGHYPMAGLIQRAYGRLGLGRPPVPGSALPVSGAPAWVYSDYYVINAESAGKTNKELMEGPMLQALLEDRFNLRLHRASIAVPVYTLTIAKGGARLREVPEGTCTPPNFLTWPTLPPGKRYCNNRGRWRQEGAKHNSRPGGRHRRLFL
jgi:bla regulator protein BlaR1